MQQLGHERLLLVVLLTFVLSMQAATSPAATAAWNFGGGAHLVLRLPLSPAVTATAIPPAQDPAVVEASLDLDRSTRRLIQQGLRNEGFDPGRSEGRPSRRRRRTGRRRARPVAHRAAHATVTGSPWRPSAPDRHVVDFPRLQARARSQDYWVTGDSLTVRFLFFRRHSGCGRDCSDERRPPHSRRPVDGLD